MLVTDSTNEFKYLTVLDDYKLSNCNFVLCAYHCTCVTAVYA